MAKAKQNLTKRIKHEKDEAATARLIARLSAKKRKSFGLDAVAT